MNMCQNTRHTVSDNLKRYGKHFLFCVCLQLWYLTEQTSKTSLLHGENAYSQCNSNAWLYGFIQFTTATVFPPKSVRGAVFNLAVMQRQFNTTPSPHHQPPFSESVPHSEESPSHILLVSAHLGKMAVSK